MVITKTKPSQWLGAAPPDPRIWDLLLGIGTAHENFLPTPVDKTHIGNTKYTILDCQFANVVMLGSIIQSW